MGAASHRLPAGRSMAPSGAARRRQRGPPGCGASPPARSRALALAAGCALLLVLLPAFLSLPAAVDVVPAVGTGRRDVTLLIWTHPFERRRPLPDCAERFSIPGCALTDDPAAYRRADAVVIHHREIAAGGAPLPPEPRPGAQTWIWMNYESPEHTAGLRRLGGVFNLTMSYRADSDIFLPYGYLVPRTAGAARRTGARLLPVPSRAELLRPRVAAWVVSNWSESHARVSFYRQLRRYLPVDVFGRAGRPVPEDRGRGSVVRLARRYQFYLALENSQHTDYITEKLWNAVLAGAVPVVLGPSRRNYERFLPAEAFIHVDDFPSVRGLARYLRALRRHPARLLRHLGWREDYRLRRPAFWAEHFCTACEAVRRTRGRTHVVRDIASWFRS